MLGSLRLFQDLKPQKFIQSPASGRRKQEPWPSPYPLPSNKEIIRGKCPNHPRITNKYNESLFLHTPLDLQDPEWSQTSSSHHHYPKVLSPATKSLGSGSKPVSDFLAETAAAGVSCCPAFPLRKAIYVPNRQRRRKGSSISTVHFTVSAIIYSTWILYIHHCVLQTLSSQRGGRRWENSL